MQRLPLAAARALALLAIAGSAVASQPAFPSAAPGFSPIEGPWPAYVRIAQPRTSMEVVLPADPVSAASPSYRVAAYQVDCQAGGVKYESVRTVDAATHRVMSSLSMPKTVWHRPRAGSVEAQALSRTCAR